MRQVLLLLPFLLFQLFLRRKAYIQIQVCLIPEPVINHILYKPKEEFYGDLKKIQVLAITGITYTVLSIFTDGFIP